MSEIYAGTHLVGGMTADWWSRDPQRMAFVAARYKFVARMLQGKARVLEVGCADGFFSRIVRQHVGHLTAIDIDRQAIGEARSRHPGEWPVEFMVHDILSGPPVGAPFDAAFALDVLEHMSNGADDETFVESMIDAVNGQTCIFGVPSKESQVYASELSKAGHVNCMTENELRGLLKLYWRDVFIFGMNDETLHTGFGPMSHYRLALCVA